MAIEFCPLADEVGNLADWTAVVVGAIAAAATTTVAVLAYMTSNRATRIAGDAKKIAQDQHNDYVAQREGTSRILGSLLQMEVAVLPLKLAPLLQRFDHAFELFAVNKLDGSTKLVVAISELNGSFLPGAERVLDQLHTLPNQLGAKIASMIGMTREIADTAKRIDVRFIRVPDPEGGIFIAGYRSDKEDFESLRTQIRAMLRSSIDLAECFNEFSKADGLDYDEERTVAELVD